MGYSKTYLGVIIVFLGMLSKWTGLPAISDSNAETTISTIIQFVGMITALIGRYKAGGINTLGFKK